MAERGSSRRDFLRLAGAALAAGAAGLPGRPDLDSALGAARRGLSLRRLAARMQGPLIRPSSRRYNRAKRNWNPRYDRIRPRAIALCENQRDVREVIRYARERDVRIAARSGAHSFAGYCTTEGIVADVSRMNRIVVDRDAGHAVVGAGANLADLYYELVIRRGVDIPGGTCPTVGIAGIAMGGGLGSLTRLHGATLDNMLEAELVLANGDVVRCNEDRNSDLFWAVRGGGGGNFGIATEFRFRIHRVGKVATFDVKWPWSQAPEALDAWQRSLPHASDRLASTSCRATKTLPASGEGPGTLEVKAGGQYHGPESELRDLLGPLLAVEGASAKITTDPYVQANIPNGCTLNGTARPTCQVTRYPNYQRSDFVDRPWSQEALETVVKWTERWPGSANSHEGGVQLEAEGGAINRPRKRATAYVHRDQLFHCVYLNFWGANQGHAASRANIRWVRRFYEEMRPFVSGFAYQNYIDPELESWRHAYYGVNYPRLQRIKGQVDPDNLFRFRQSIRPR